MLRKKNFLRMLALVMVLCMMLTACGPAVQPEEPENTIPQVQQPEQKPEPKPETGKDQLTNLSGSIKNPEVPEKGTYREGVVLVKYDGEMTQQVLEQLGCMSATPLYTGSSWYVLELAEGDDTVAKVTYLRQLDCFGKVDYDYVMSNGSETSSVDVSHNPDYDKHDHHHTHKIPEGWDHMVEQGINPGGSSDVVVAVIDTGVDYNHLDLRNNIWVNSAEIPDNGKDDDGNGYIDDVYGWDCVGNDNDPMDDNGHGTHVAGIIAAENNEIGGVGIAYNCQIMCIKAGNSSGYFNNSDIAEAIQYAYMNGASVINMSFGGSFISIAVEEALENAYTTCVLVAAAGNDSKCNNVACEACDNVGVSYPAALPYVIGVMSTNATGDIVSGFSNYDHYPHDSVEYEVYAVGESVPSCWPGNKYASLNGTSMAAPTVSAIAALLRSAFPDRNVYSTKYLQSQIVNTGTVNPYNLLLEDYDGDHSVANVFEALTRIPKPAVNLYDYYIDDSADIHEANNGNGVIDAGETVHLYVSLMNRGGVASNVKVSIDTIHSEGLTDPYFTFTNPSISLSDIGTYSVREAGEEQYFEIIVDAACPNDYLVNFNISFTYENGLDAEDHTIYEDDGRQQARFNVSSGYHLPGIIAEDTVFAADRLYIVGQNVMIPAGVTVTFEEGCQIQFYADQEYYNSPEISVYGTLYLEGTETNMVSITPSERYANFACLIKVKESGIVEAHYLDAMNLMLIDTVTRAKTTVANSLLRQNGTNIYHYDGGKVSGGDTETLLKIDECRDSYVDFIKWNSHRFRVGKMSGCYIRIYTNNATAVEIGSEFVNNIVYAEYYDNGATTHPLYFGDNCVITGNVFRSSDDENIYALVPLSLGTGFVASNNTFSAGYQKYASQIIENYLDANGNPIIDITGSCDDIAAQYPHVVNVEIFNADNEPITTIGKEEIKVRVTFNRPMAQTENTFLTFGTIEPYADYKIEGEWVSELVWEGTYTLKAQIENGQNYLKVNNVCAAEDVTKKVRGEYQLHEFTIDTTAAMSMNLFAEATDEGIKLTWNQDDYDTLMGYNIYRSTDKNGNFVKINPSVLLATDELFLDDNAEPGVTYWYTFTVVLSDFSESAPAGKVSCTAVDTMAPSLYHTPVNQGYLQNNLVISCTASDNIAISSVTLYYRVVGIDAWKSLPMSRHNDKFSATIFGSELTLDGLEYYIVAQDKGGNTVSKASAEEPYTVVIKDASAISRKGDVDGDGTVTMKDALMIMQAMEEKRILTDDEFLRADLNGSGVLEAMEALSILQYINGNINDLDLTK